MFCHFKLKITSHTHLMASVRTICSCPKPVFVWFLNFSCSNSLHMPAIHCGFSFLFLIHPKPAVTHAAVPKWPGQGSKMIWDWGEDDFPAFSQTQPRPSAAKKPHHPSLPPRHPSCHPNSICSTQNAHFSNGQTLRASVFLLALPPRLMCFPEAAGSPHTEVIVANLFLPFR